MKHEGKARRRVLKRGRHAEEETQASGKTERARVVTGSQGGEEGHTGETRESRRARDR